MMTLTRTISLAVAAVSAFSLAALRPAAARAQVAVSAEVDVGAPVEVDSFHARLASSGRWIHVGGYDDEVWIPAGIHEGWRPYSEGQWVLTEYGWTFVSDDPWGWATWHYGNWMLTDDAGWVWAPGPTWAPAWVSWRYGGGYAAWAPLPPQGFHVAVYGYASPAWVCVPEAHFTEPVARFAVSVNVSARYVQAARPLAVPVRTGGIEVNPGPRAEVVAAAVGHPVVAVSARAVVGHGTASIARAPAAPKPPAAIAHAMQRSWAKAPGPARTGNAAPGARPRPNGAPATSAAHAQVAPNARPSRPGAPARAMPPIDAAEQKARAQQEVQANQQRANATQERREERVGGMSNAEPPASEERARTNAEKANDERTNNERTNDARAAPAHPEERRASPPAQHTAATHPAHPAAKAPAPPAPHPAGRRAARQHRT